MCKMTKTTFKVSQAPSTGLRFVSKQVDEMSKNHRETDKENLGGFMPELRDNILCPVSSFIKYVDKLNKKCDRLWQRPRDTYCCDDPEWYCNVPICEKTLSTFMTVLSKSCNLSTIYTNHSLRATGATMLSRNRFGAAQIMSVTGHKSVSSLAVYQRVSDGEKLAMGHSIGLQCLQAAQNKDVQALPAPPLPVALPLPTPPLPVALPLPPPPLPAAATLSLPAPVPLNVPTPAPLPAVPSTSTSSTVVDVTEESVGRQSLCEDAICGSSGTIPSFATGIVSQQCLHCICKYGSSCPCRWDVYSNSCGYFQLKEYYWRDCGEPGSSFLACSSDLHCSSSCVQNYMKRFIGGSGCTHNCETYARIHGGGPAGCYHDSTLQFWSEVESMGCSAYS